MLDEILEKRLVIFEAIHRMLAITGEASGLFYEVQLVDGAPYFGDVIFSDNSPERMKSFASTLPNKPMLQGTATATHEAPSWRRGRWSARAPARTLLNHFSILADDVEQRAVRRSEIWQKVYVPLDINDQLRALVFDGPRLLGWLGVWRHGPDGRFSRAELASLNAQRHDPLRLIRNAESVRREQLARAPLYAIADAERGQLLCASAAMSDWLTGQRLAHLSYCLRALQLEQRCPPAILIDGVVLRPLRLDETLARPAWLLVPGPHSAIMLQPERLLTARQLEVARLLCAGLAEGEIAAELDVELSTVKYHRKAIFHALGVDTKPALIKLLSHDL